MDFIKYFDLMDQLDKDEERASRKKKVYKERADPFLLNDNDFRKKYRFTKNFARKIIELITDDIKQDTRGGGVSAELQVLTALRTWTRQEIQDDAADLHGLSQQSITNVCRRVALALASRAAHFIYMPSSMAEQEEVISGFQQICGFRNVIGAIDCTHIKIRKVGRDARQYYVNRKGVCSINVQVICDSSLKIRDINVARWTGSTHDTIFWESAIRERFEADRFCGRLIGDSGYALTPYLFTPVPNPTSKSEEAYNMAHMYTRSTVEQCLGLWKQRFRCLLTGFTVSLQHVELYIIALAILHNIAIDMGEGVEDIAHEEVPMGEPYVPAVRHENQLGQIDRRLFIDNYF